MRSEPPCSPAHWTQPLDRALVRRPDAQGFGSELGTDLS